MVERHDPDNFPLFSDAGIVRVGIFRMCLLIWLTLPDMRQVIYSDAQSLLKFLDRLSGYNTAQGATANALIYIQTAFPIA